MSNKKPQLLDGMALRQWRLKVKAFRRRGKVFYLESNRGAKALHITASEEESKRRLSAVEHLARGGFTSLPRPILNRFGDSCSRAFNGYYSISDWIEGRPLRLGEANEAVLAARSLASLHTASQGFMPRGEPFFRLPARETASAMLAYRNMSLAGPRWREGLSFVYAQAAAVLRLLTPATEQKLKQRVSQEGGICLSADLSKALRIDEEGHVFALDFGEWQPGPGAVDVAELLLHCGEQGAWRSAASCSALEEYLLLRPLPDEERDLLLAALILPYEPLMLLRGFGGGQFDMGELETRWQAACGYEKSKMTWIEGLAPLLYRGKR
ncbi:MAG: hypothetical protein FWE85_01970 [Clostridiales bacterium]|nr:hypothetical protein [Clostridiales bacterium]